MIKENSKDRRFQPMMNMNCAEPNETEDKFKRAMVAALASIITGNTEDAEIFLRVGLGGGNINDANDFKRLKLYLKH